MTASYSALFLSALSAQLIRSLSLRPFTPNMETWSLLLFALKDKGQLFLNKTKSYFDLRNITGE